MYLPLPTATEGVGKRKVFYLGSSASSLAVKQFLFVFLPYSDEPQSLLTLFASDATKRPPNTKPTTEQKMWRALENVAGSKILH